MRSSYICAALILGLALSVANSQQVPDAGFPFVVPPEGPLNGTAPADLRPMVGAAGSKGSIALRHGHFETEHGGERVNLWGTNLCFSGCFPTHEIAERMAGRLQGLGINAIRFHHMDTAAWPDGIWRGKGWGGFPHEELHPEALDRLDYLVAQLKRRGIYSNLNLHVGRTFGPEDGYPAVEHRHLRRGKGVCFFHPRMQRDQKNYARMLLDRENPYTGNHYRDEPALAMLEISNENSVIHAWSRGYLQEMPEEYDRLLEDAWNRWLRSQYDTTQALKAAWSEGANPEHGAELVPQDRGGRLATAGGARATEEPVAGQSGQAATRVEVQTPGKRSWHVQYHWPVAGTLKRGEAYRLRIRVKGPSGATARLSVMQDESPWRSLGLSQAVSLNGQWQAMDIAFRPSADSDQARITLGGLSGLDKPVEFQRPSLQRASVTGLPDGQGVGDDETVLWPRKDEVPARTHPVGRAVVRFLYDTEVQYWRDMYQFLRDELGMRAMITGTAVGHTSPWIAAGTGDYVDSHAYWQHPFWPDAPAWDRERWLVRQSALVNAPDGGPLAHLAYRRALNSAYTISEYNHPAPNRYEAEGFPLLAVFGARQNWDGAFTFNYTNGEPETDQFHRYFDWAGHPVKVALQPACSATFREGALPTGRTISHLRSTAAGRVEAILRGGPVQGIREFLRGNMEGRPWVHALCATAVCHCRPDERDVPGEFSWDQEDPDRGYVRYRGRGCMGLVGFIEGRRLTHGSLTLIPGGTSLDGFGALMVNAVDGQERPGEPGRYLVTAVVRAWNQDMSWNEAGNSVGNGWGHGPSLCEGLPLQLRTGAAVADVQLYPLEPDGSRKDAVGPDTGQDGETVFRVGPEHETLWYELVIGP